jgi:hypothetical protein
LERDKVRVVRGAAHTSNDSLALWERAGVRVVREVPHKDRTTAGNPPWQACQPYNVKILNGDVLSGRLLSAI